VVQVDNGECRDREQYRYKKRECAGGHNCMNVCMDLCGGRTYRLKSDSILRADESASLIIENVSVSLA
jgi:hypothetical protein